jgi:ABC-2 type transport system ATP-binding protein
MAVIESINIEKKFGDFTAVKDVTLRIGKGEFFGLFGPNGAGKTTLLKILTGQLEQTSGIAKVLDLDVKNVPIEVKRKVGIVPEVESPPSYLTAYEYLYFVAKVHKVKNEDKEIAQWLKYFELEGSENILCKELSKGMRQKLMLSAAFIHKPRVMFLDEPFINLDPIYQRKVRDYLIGFVNNGGTIFMCTHILEIAEKLCRTVAIIHKGSIVAEGSIDDLLKGYDNLQDAFMKHVNDEGRAK